MKVFLKLCAIFLTVVLFLSPQKASAQFFFDKNPLIGKPAKDFTLKLYGGEKTNMTQLRNNQSAIIFFWATWCPHCREALKELNADPAGFAKKGIKLLLVDVGEEENQVKSYVERNKVGLPIFLDSDGSLSDSYGVIGVPTFYFVDAEGVVREVDHGLPDNYEEILKGKSSKPGQTAEAKPTERKKLWGIF